MVAGHYETWEQKQQRKDMEGRKAIERQKEDKNPIVGVDVSHHNGKIDWEKVADAGVKWASIKATEGYSFADPKYHVNLREAQGSGLEVIPYHFAHPHDDVLVQVQHFDHVTNCYGITKPVVLDWEYRLADANVTDQIKWIKQWVKAFPKTILYCNRTEIKPLVSSFARQIPLWIAAPMKSMTLQNPPHKEWVKDLKIDPKWNIVAWQYSWHGEVPGILGDVDLDLVVRS